ncbi:MAG: PDZ domain-containing protein [Geminicoccaceae bacterium]
MLGLDLATLNDEARQAAGLEAGAQGVLVVGVSEDADGTVQPGDVILSVDNRPVATPAQVAGAFRRHRRRSMRPFSS